jgi:hypothetical protein
MGVIWSYRFAHVVNGRYKWESKEFLTAATFVC